MRSFSIPSFDANDQNGLSNLLTLWRVAVVILGFQIGALTYRITREREFAAKDEDTWFPFADKLNLASILVNIIGVFLLPIFGVTTLNPKGALALALMLFGAYGFALAGHYELFFRNWDKLKYFPPQEQVVVSAAVVLVALACLHFQHPVWAALVFLGSLTLIFIGIFMRKVSGQKLVQSVPQDSPSKET